MLENGLRLWQKKHVLRLNDSITSMSHAILQELCAKYVHTTYVIIIIIILNIQLNTLAVHMCVCLDSYIEVRNIVYTCGFTLTIRFANYHGIQRSSGISSRSQSIFVIIGYTEPATVQNSS